MREALQRRIHEAGVAQVSEPRRTRPSSLLPRGVGRCLFGGGGRRRRRRRRKDDDRRRRPGGTVVVVLRSLESDHRLSNDTVGRLWRGDWELCLCIRCFVFQSFFLATFRFSVFRWVRFKANGVRNKTRLTSEGPHSRSSSASSQSSSSILISSLPLSLPAVWDILF